jgi:hypothetical protein
MRSIRRQDGQDAQRSELTGPAPPPTLTNHRPPSLKARRRRVRLNEMLGRNCHLLAENDAAITLPWPLRKRNETVPAPRVEGNQVLRGLRRVHRELAIATFARPRFGPGHQSRANTPALERGFDRELMGGGNVGLPIPRSGGAGLGAHDRDGSHNSRFSDGDYALTPSDTLGGFFHRLIDGCVVEPGCSKGRIRAMK